MASKIKELLDEHLEIFKSLYELEEKIQKSVEMISEAIKNGGKLLVCGNGGSAADAQHIAAEFVNKFRKERKPLPAIALTTDTSILTSISNDYDFKDVFRKQIEAIGKRGDVLLAISTSGRSKNVLNAIKYAKTNGIYTIGLSGENPMGCDIDICVPSNNTPRIQEMHVLLYHIICELVEELLCKEQYFSTETEQ